MAYYSTSIHLLDKIIVEAIQGVEHRKFPFKKERLNPGTIFENIQKSEKIIQMNIKEKLKKYFKPYEQNSVSNAFNNFILLNNSNILLHDNNTSVNQRTIDVLNIIGSGNLLDNENKSKRNQSKLNKTSLDFKVNLNSNFDIKKGFSFSIPSKKKAENLEYPNQESIKSRKLDSNNSYGIEDDQNLLKKQISKYSSIESTKSNQLKGYTKKLPSSLESYKNVNNRFRKLNNNFNNANKASPSKNINDSKANEKDSYRKIILDNNINRSSNNNEKTNNRTEKLIFSNDKSKHPTMLLKHNSYGNFENNNNNIDLIKNINTNDDGNKINKRNVLKISSAVKNKPLNNILPEEEKYKFNSKAENTGVFNDGDCRVIHNCNETSQFLKRTTSNKIIRDFRILEFNRNRNSFVGRIKKLKSYEYQSSKDSCYNKAAKKQKSNLLLLDNNEADFLQSKGVQRTKTTTKNFFNENTGFLNQEYQTKANKSINLNTAKYYFNNSKRGLTNSKGFSFNKTMLFREDKEINLKKHNIMTSNIITKKNFNDFKFYVNEASIPYRNNFSLKSFFIKPIEQNSNRFLFETAVKLGK